MPDSLTVAIAIGATAAVGLVAKLVRQRPHADSSVKNLSVVVTGSTRGLGLAMAKEFAKLGDSVVVSGRQESAVESARTAVLAAAADNVRPGQKVVGIACDISSPNGCDQLAAAAREALGGIDLWVNNAGMTQHPKAPLASTPAETIQTIISTNLVGTMLGCKAALSVMLEQKRGCIFNMDGAGSRGNATGLSAAYGASKAAIPQLGKTLASELPKSSGVRVHTASPGMVTTELLLKGATPRSLKIFNILAEEPETTAAWLVPRMRGAIAAPSGQYIKYLTPSGAAWRFATAPWRKDRLIKVVE